MVDCLITYLRLAFEDVGVADIANVFPSTGCIYESIMAYVTAFKKAATPSGKEYANGYANGSASKKRI